MQQLSQTCLRRRFTQVATALTLLTTLNGCAVVATGAAALGVSSVTDPRTIGSQLDDQTIEMKANAKLGNDEQLGEYRLRVVSYDQNVLLIGQVPNDPLVNVPSASLAILTVSITFLTRYVSRPMTPGLPVR